LRVGVEKGVGGLGVRGSEGAYGVNILLKEFGERKREKRKKIGKIEGKENEKSRREKGIDGKWLREEERESLMRSPLVFSFFFLFLIEQEHVKNNFIRHHIHQMKIIMEGNRKRNIDIKTSKR
jgi:hypothetical protein